MNAKWCPSGYEIDAILWAAVAVVFGAGLLLGLLA